MKKSAIASLLAAGCLAGAAMLLGGCSGGGGAAQGDTVKIAVAAPLTGPSAQDGNAIKDGVALAVKQLNAKGGVNKKKVEVVVNDDKGDPSEAATVANKLAQDKAILGVVGHFNSSCTLAGAPIYNKAGVVEISPGSSAAAVSQAGSFTFRTITTDAVQSKSLAKWAVNDLGYRRVAIMYENNDYGSGLSEVMGKAVKELGAQVVANEAYEVGATDFSTALTKLATVSPDVLIIGGLYNETALIAKQKGNLGLEKLPIMSVDAIYSDALITLGGQAVEGIKMTAYFSEDSKEPVSVAFLKDFKESYKKTPSTYAAYAYDAALILCDAIGKAGADRKAVRDALAKTKDYQGATGKDSFDANGDVIKEPLRIIIKGGKYLLTEK